jgi:transglutaminase-like putative cysteine protease
LRSQKLLFILALLALPLSAKESVREFDVRPAPAWVERLAMNPDVRVARENVRWGIYDILSDHQVRVADGAESQYFRTMRKVLSPSGVQNASELELDFDPSFQRLTIHEIAIHRAGARIDALEADEIRVIDKEDDTESRIYDGERTALIFIKDVRPGDVIDYSWSLGGANPILDGRYTDEYDLSSGVPSQRIRHRLVWNAGRPLQWRGGDPAITTSGSEQFLVWERTGVRAIHLEDETPSWYEPWVSVQVTEFASWSEVARWSDAMFQLDARSRDEVRQLAARIAGEHPTRDARITAAMRFVQDEIRYLGIEMGRNSHEPHQPWETLEGRWGDCKDKTLLLVALLRELGLEAYPALVNTRIGHRLAEKLPSPFLFDHVIAQVVERGRVYWVDGTISDQGGTLPTIETPNYGRALVVRSDTTALTAITTSTKGATLVEQTYTTTDYAKPTLLTVKATYTGGVADAVRSHLASLSIEDFAHDRINDLAVDQPKIEASGLPHISDDRLRNTIVIIEKYRVPELWKDGEWTWYPRVIERRLTRPDTMIRTMPLDFDYPLDVTQVVTLNFAEDVPVEKSTSATETPAFRYEYLVDGGGKSVTIRQRLRARRDYVDVKDVADHLTKLNAIWSEIGYRLQPDGAQPKKSATSSPLATWVIGLAAVGLFVAVCWALAVRRPKPEPALVFARGEAPQSALAIARADEIDAHLAGLGCACGARHYSTPDVQRARYAEREMTIVTRHCGACGREQSVYFTAA